YFPDEKITSFSCFYSTMSSIIWQAMVTLPFLIFIAVLGVGIVIPVLPIYATAFGATGLEIGLVFSLLSLSRMLGVILIGGIADRYGKKGFIILGLIIYLISSVLYVYAGNLKDLMGILLVKKDYIWV
ncbi:MAG: MFS transporter, partial [Chloroflexi bacterium]|nr:MFS transporter [Chloroflexota bacterium]